MQINILKSVILSFLLLAGTGSFYAQETKSTNEEMEQDSIPPMRIQQTSLNMYDEYFSVSSPSPDIAELMKYVEIPVDLNTGVPSIQIPLYEIQCGDLTLPVTLSYHAGGIKIDQVASWVGLGWSLNAGGAISCTQIDRGREFKTAYSLPNHAEMGPTLAPMNFDSSTAVLEHWMKDKSVPDLFNYNFMGYSGKFFVYDHKIYELSGSQELEFSSPYPAMDKKIATDLRGRVYEFDEVEYSRTYSWGLLYSESSKVWEHASRDDKASPYSYSWMLTKVSSTYSQHSISFSYRDERESFKGMTAVSLSRGSYGNWGALKDEFGYSTSSPAYTIADTYSETKKLKEIKASNGIRIVFTADIVREDIVKNPDSPEDRPNALSKIIIYDSNDRQIKKWTFHYDYFISNVPHPKNTYSNLRLKLTKLVEYGENTNEPRTYTFAYYGEESGEPTMPFRGSFAGRDFLGYCNSKPGQAQTISLSKCLPRASKSVPFMGKFFPDEIEYSEGADLNTNAAYVHAYSLKSITYPAGGKRVFEYEPHQLGLYHYGGLRIKKIYDYFSETEYTFKEYDYGMGYTTSPVTMFRTRRRDSYTDKLRNISRRIPSPYPIYDVFSSPETSLASYTGEGIRYPRVYEKMGDSQIEYQYSNTSDAPAIYTCYRAMFVNNGEKHLSVYEWENFDEYDRNVYFNLIVPDYKHGHLTSKKTRAEDGVVIVEEYEYDFEDKDIVPIVQCTYGGKEWCANGYPYYDIVAASYVTGKARMKSKTTKWCRSSLRTDRNSPYMSQQEIYTYNEYDKLESVQTINSKGEEITTLTRYVSDINKEPYKEMKALRMIDYPVEMVTRLEGEAVAGTLMTYAKFSKQLYRPAKIYQLEATAPLSSFSNFSGTVGGWYGDEFAEIKKYTSKGKIMAIKNNEQMDMVYLWGYNQQYPIAEVRNATYTDVTAIIPEDDINKIADKNEPSSEDWTKIEKLRGISGAQVTITKYKPHFGTTSVTGPDLRPIYFDYNSHGQLKEKYYMNGNKKEVIERYDYNYKNE